MSRTRQIEYYVSAKIRQMIISEDTGPGKKLYADLRKGLGKAPGELPELWGNLLLGMPEELYGLENTPGNAEWACYISLTLYALHQQGYGAKKTPMYVEGNTFGKALRLLADAFDDSNAEKRVLEKMKILASAKDINETAYYLRSIVQLLRSKGIPLDYASLGGDIYLLQSSDHASEVKLKWGRDFYRTSKLNGVKGDN